MKQSLCGFLGLLFLAPCCRHPSGWLRTVSRFPKFSELQLTGPVKVFHACIEYFPNTGPKPTSCLGSGLQAWLSQFLVFIWSVKVIKKITIWGFSDGWSLHTHTVFLCLTLFWSKQGDLRCLALHPPLGGLQQVASLVRIYGQVLLVQCKQTKFYGANTERSWTLQFDCTMTEKHGFIYSVVPVRCLQEFQQFNSMMIKTIISIHIFASQLLHLMLLECLNSLALPCNTFFWSPTDPPRLSCVVMDAVGCDSIARGRPLSRGWLKHKSGSPFHHTSFHRQAVGDSTGSK